MIAAPELFVGEVIGHEILTFDRHSRPSRVRVTTYRLIESIKGDQDEIVEVAFTSSFGRDFASVAIGERMIVAAIKGKDGGAYISIPPACGGVSQVPVTKGNVAIFKARVAQFGGGLDFSIIPADPIEIPAQKKAPSGEWKILLGVVLFSVLLAAVFAMFRVRRGLSDQRGAKGP